MSSKHKYIIDDIGLTEEEQLEIGKLFDDGYGKKFRILNAGGEDDTTENK